MNNLSYVDDTGNGSRKHERSSKPAQVCSNVNKPMIALIHVLINKKTAAEYWESSIRIGKTSLKQGDGIKQEETHQDAISKLMTPTWSRDNPEIIWVQ